MSLGDAGIVDEDVEALHGGFRGRDQRLDRVLVGEVGLDHVDALAERSGELVEGGPARAGQRHRGAPGVQRAGDGAADAAGGAGDEAPSC